LELDVFVVTGGNGFVGGALIQELVDRGYAVRAAARALPDTQRDKVDYVLAPALDVEADWQDVVRDASIIIHTAGRVHIMHEKSNDALAEFRRVNVEGTLSFARQAAEAGVKRFVFLSSAKANGEETLKGQPFSADSEPDPKDPYGQSKLEAEIGLRQLGEQFDMEITILRLPLVYGPGVKGNFATMMRILKLGIPLPLASVDNRRSMIGLNNLIDIIILSSHHIKAKNQTFLVSDGDDLSTERLLRLLGRAIGCDARLFYCPTALLSFGAVLFGQTEMARRLLASLELDISKTRKLLDWTPPFRVEQELQNIANSFRG